MGFRQRDSGANPFAGLVDKFVAIDHLLTKQGGGHDGHDQTGMLSDRISCSAVGLNWFGQIDTTSSYSAGGAGESPKEGVLGASGNSEPCPSV